MSISFANAYMYAPFPKVNASAVPAPTGRMLVSQNCLVIPLLESSTVLPDATMMWATVPVTTIPSPDRNYVHYASITTKFSAKANLSP